MFKIVCCICVLTFCLQVESAGQKSKASINTGSPAVSKYHVWYVSGNGNDDNSGNSVKAAWKSLQKAARIVQPGDTVLMDTGIYTNEDKSDVSSILNITTSGTSEAWITWKAMKGARPEIRPFGWSGVTVSASYIVLDGIYVLGANDSLVLKDAIEDGKKPTANAQFNSNGIFINGRPRKSDEKPHHIIVRNCEVSKCPGGGITAIEADYVTIEDCTVYDNCWYMRFGGSGITTLNNWAHDDLPGYHIVIQRNKVWNNKTLVPWSHIGKLSDGNGILLDVTDQSDGATNPNADTMLAENTKKATIEKPKRPEWKGAHLK